MTECIIRVTGGTEAPTLEQKTEILDRFRELVLRVLGENPPTTEVSISGVAPDRWGIAGLSTTLHHREP